MKKKYITKKNKKFKKTLKIIKKVGGGSVVLNNKNLQPTTNQTVSPLEISNSNELKKMEEDRDRNFENKTSELITNSSNIAKGLAINSIKGIGNLIGVDVTNPEEINQNLENIKKSLTNPQNIENIKKIINNFSENSGIYLEAAKPLINPLMDIVDKVGNKVATQFADTSSTIASNLVKEIPGVGLVYSSIQDASKIGDAFSAVVGAASELTEKGADALVVAKRNVERLKAEALQIKNRTANSINAFSNVNIPTLPSVPSVPNVNTVAKIPSTKSINSSLKTGGTKYKYKNNQNKTKRVRFTI